MLGHDSPRFARIVGILSDEFLADFELSSAAFDARDEPDEACDERERAAGHDEGAAEAHDRPATTFDEGASATVCGSLTTIFCTSAAFATSLILACRRVPK